MFRQRIFILILSIFTVCFPETSLAEDRFPVFVSIAPQKYFVQQIGKDLVDIQVMVPPSANPHIFEPKPRQMTALAKTRLYFAIGVPFENVWLAKIADANPNMKIVHTDHGIDKIPMEAHHHHEDEHAEGSERDPHIWLAPPLVKIQARTIRDALQTSDPAHKADYAANYAKFVADIDRLDSDLRSVFAGKQGLRFMVFHPSWGYFAKAYNLKQIPIEIEGKNPKPAQLKELIEHARENKIRIVFVQPQFSARSAKLIAREIGGQVAFADPLAEDWMDNLRMVADKFKMALK